MLTKDLIENEINKIIESLKPYQPKKVILFGSLARGDYHEGSDVDLIILKETNLRFIERISEALSFIDCSLPVEPLVYSPDEFERLVSEGNSFLTKAIQEGRILFEQ